MSNLSLKKQLLKGGVGSLFVKAFFAFFSLVISMALARVLGAESFGIYSFVIAVVMLLSIPAVVGIPELVVRETAKNQVDNKGKGIKGLWSWSLKRGLFFSFTVVFFASLITLIFFRDIHNEKSHLLLISFYIIPFMAIIAHQSACTRGLRHTVLGQLPDNIIRPGLILTLILLFSYSQSSFTVEDAIWIYIFSVFTAAITAFLILKKVRPNDFYKVANVQSDVRIWSKAILPLSLIGGLNILNGYVDIVILGFFKSDESVGVYRAVVQLSLLVSFGLQAINQVLHPHFSRLFIQQEHKKLQNLVTISTRVILLIALPPVIIFIVYGSEILTFFFGDAFYIGGLALSVLAIGQLINAAMGSVGALLNMTGHERYTLRGVLSAAVVNVVLNFALIPLYGMLGAAIATAFSLGWWNLLLRYYVCKKLKIEPSAFFRY